MQQTRYDKFQVSEKNWREDSNGFLHIDNARPTRVGVLQYSDGQGNTWGELRHPDDVFDSESLESIKQLPYVHTHPGEMITPETAKELMNGVSGENARADGDYIACNLTVHHAPSIKDIKKNKKVELSMGYKANVMDESGTFRGIPYQKRQTDIRYNHWARVTKGRAGEGCSIRLDSNSALADIHESHKEDQIMKIVKRDIGSIEVGVFKMDAMTVEIPEEHSGSIEALLGREKQFVDGLTTLTEKNDALQAKVDGLEAENTEAKKTAEGLVSADRMDALVLERAEIMTKA
ncbi:MAG: DUF2213 domain-containing protein, partial [Deltaproteobacteria bacterium]|nr:DUF2213 domain-containing protein [Deltaproteobacteria bacterium]